MPSALVLLAFAVIAPTGGSANGTTLPFQRHIVRAIAPGQGRPTLAAVVQKQGADGDGLTLSTSIDGGASWHRDLALQPHASVRDTADLLPDVDGRGFSLLYSLEPESSRFREDARSDVILLHLALVRPGNFRVDAGPTVIFHPVRGEAYFRASLARDAQGVLHVAATHLSRGSFSFRAVALAGGKRGAPETLQSFGRVFGGGRLLAVGGAVLAVYDDYAMGHPARARLRPAGRAAAWGPERVAAPDGLYHAGAFSLTATPDGHAHLVYSDKGAQALQYREFDGRAWSARSTVDPQGHWANQAAVSHQGSTVLIAWNHFDPATGMMDVRVRERTRAGLAPVRAVATATTFKGYTTAIEAVVPGEPWVVAWCEQRVINLPPARAVAEPLAVRASGVVVTPPIRAPRGERPPRIVGP
ncbi:MAG: hypothetical protein NVSMB23_07620 [Myxococcales bacterium]